MSKNFIAAAFAAGCLLASGAAAQTNLTAETAGAAGVPGTVVQHLGEVAAGAGVANIQVQTGQTLTNSIQNVAEGKTDIAAAPQVLPFLLSVGRGPYSSLGAEKGAELAGNLRYLYTYAFGYHMLYAYDSVGMNGWADMAGRTIYNGPPRGAALVQARAFAQLLGAGKDGEDYTGVQVNWAQDLKTITDGSAQAVLLPSTFPDRRITASLAAGNMTVWSMPKDAYEGEAMQKYLTTPGNAPLRVPMSEVDFGDGVTVMTEDDIFRTGATAGGEVVNASMSFETAKALTAAFIEGIPALKAKAPWAGQVGIGVTSVPESGMCGLNPIPYHPGAVAAWEEAGYTIPDCAKPKG
ncbi:MAG: TAXI family TRAP transporter solute-binding subunit [Pseudomonadota bacterium]